LLSSMNYQLSTRAESASQEPQQTFTLLNSSKKTSVAD
jgi:hypothetical protein